jgi:outer membrane protein assembly factor BamB
MKRSIYLIVYLFLNILSNTLISQQSKINWWFDTKDNAFGQAAAADIDKDDTLEIVFSTYRNDSMIYALNAEDGSILWQYNTGGCNDVAPLIFDVDQDDTLEVIVPGSCVAKTFCLNGVTGKLKWSTKTRGSDSPPTVGDIDNDGKPEILHGEFGGYVICINGEDGSIAWELPVDLKSWIQTAPALLDVDQNGQLDFVVANWSFDNDDRIWAFNGKDQSIIWEDTTPQGYFYHGVSFGDLDKDGKKELAIGSYDGNLYCYEAESGIIKWKHKVPGSQYAGTPSVMADINMDDSLEIVYVDGNKIVTVNNRGKLLWKYEITGNGTSFRGVAIADVNEDDTLDVVFGSSVGNLEILNGLTGKLMFKMDLQSHYGKQYKIDHAPLIADFDLDDTLDVFIVGGHAEYPNIANNYGRAYSVQLDKGFGPDWLMFRHDPKRSACLCNDSIVNAVPYSIPKSKMTFKVFPNPTFDNLVIEFQNANFPLTVTIANILGVNLFMKEIFNQRTILSISNLGSGQYIISVVGEKNTINQSFIKIE